MKTGIFFESQRKDWLYESYLEAQYSVLILFLFCIGY